VTWVPNAKCKIACTKSPDAVRRAHERHRRFRGVGASLLRVIICGLVLLIVSAGTTRADDLDCNAPKVAIDDCIAAWNRTVQAGGVQGHDLAVAYQNRGVGYFRKGQDEQALADFEHAITLDPAYALGYRGRGSVLARRGDVDRAIKDFDQAIQLNQKDAATLANRGDAWRQKGDLDRALVDLDLAIQLDPNLVLAFAARGRLWESKGELNRGIADENEAIRIDPRNSIAFHTRGLCWQRKGELDRALADYDQAIRLNPGYAVAFFNRGLAFAQKGDIDRALADYDQAIHFNASLIGAFVNRGSIFLRKGNLDHALADFNEALRLNPRYSPALANRGLVLRRQGQIDRAIADFTEAIRLDPAYSAAFTNRGLAYESKHDLVHARADFQAAVGLPPKYDNGQWAHDTAQARLAVLSAAPVKPEPPVTGPQPNLTSSPVIRAGSRLALVIGNGGYRNAPKLPNPANDARAVAKTLRDIDFQVIEATDLDRAGMEAALLEFLQRAPSAAVRLLFYAGHGLQIGGNNYLVPVDAMVASKNAASFELIDIDRILKGLDDEAHSNIIILDACRDNPFETRIAPSRSARSSGLIAYQSIGSGTLIAFATAPGNTAADGSGVHSPFTTALLKHVGTPAIEVNQMFTRVRVDVAAATERKQIPWVNSSLLGEVYLGAEPRASR
jgi:tetratricopeptide (TPR) repeat protein